MNQEGAGNAFQFLRAAFREYYFRGFANLELPTNLEQREFGFTSIGNRAMKRHMAFGNPGELLAYLVREVPSDIYCSNSCYVHPTYPMEQKEWMSASLIFDIDGKDLSLPCSDGHTYSRCGACGVVDHVVPERKSSKSCLSCSSERIESISIPCSKCIDASLLQVRKLNSFLNGEFGFSPDNIVVYFSGNNGFHVHVSGGEDFESLDSRARMEIVGYITAAGLMPEVLGVRKSSKDPAGWVVKHSAPDAQYGWASRINDSLKVIKASTRETTQRVKDIGGYDGIRVRIEGVADRQKAIIDPQVTSDIHRIFRLPGSINSKSSLSKVRCNDLSDFDPFTSGCVLGDALTTINVRAPVRLKLKGTSFKLGREKAEVPAFVACYLICKGVATLVG